jgi:hypothetical protein
MASNDRRMLRLIVVFKGVWVYIRVCVDAR